MEIVWSESFFKRRTITKKNFSLYSLCIYLFNCLNFICCFNWFEYIYIFLFFCLLLHRLAVSTSLPFYDVLQIIIVLIQVYNWESRHQSMVCRCGLADILFLLLFYPWFKFYFPFSVSNSSSYIIIPKTKYNKI